MNETKTKEKIEKLMQEDEFLNKYYLETKRNINISDTYFEEMKKVENLTKRQKTYFDIIFHTEETYKKYQSIFKDIKFPYTLKNYKEMCILLKEEIKTGEAKICQKKVWSKYLKYERGTTTKYIIYGLQDYNTLILNTIIENRNNIHEETQFLLKPHQQYMGGIYKIQLNNKIYIGSTKNFLGRFSSHYVLRQNANDEKSSYKKDIRWLLKNGGIFEPIIVTWVKNEEDRKKLYKLENWFIKFYSNEEEYELVNKRLEDGRGEEKNRNTNKSNKSKKKVLKYKEYYPIEIYNTKEEVIVEIEEVLKKYGIEYKIGKRRRKMIKGDMQ